MPFDYKTSNLSFDFRNSSLLIPIKRKRSDRRMATGYRPADRISRLPEPILHHIMSFLPTRDAIRTSALSKTFRSAWFSFPVIDFDLTYLSRPNYHTFLNFVHASLSRRTRNIALRKFRFRFDGVRYHTGEHKESDYFISEAIRFVQENVIKEVRLIGGLFYNVPLRISSLQSVTVLYLRGIKLRARDPNIGSDSIENLTVVNCEGLRSFEVSSSKLKILKLDSCQGLGFIDIEAPNLESFSFTAKYLRNLRAPQPCTIHMSHLSAVKNIFLKLATIESDWLNDTVPKLPQLETLKLIECDALKIVNFACGSLKQLELRHCLGIERIEVDAPSLVSFYYHGTSKPCEINIGKCKSLKKLTLKNASVTDSWVENQALQCPLLEELNLYSCLSLNNIKASWDELKSFGIERCPNVEEIEIHAPSLDMFAYTGQVLPKPVIIDSSGPRAVIRLCERIPKSKDIVWYKRVRNFLSSFGHFKSLCVQCESADELLIIPKKFRDGDLIPPLFDLRHMRVKTSSEPEDFTELLDGLLWLSPHPETISVISNVWKIYTKLEYSLPKSMTEDEFCCWLQPIKCWRHYSEKVIITENFKESERKRLIEFFNHNTKKLKTIIDNSDSS